MPWASRTPSFNSKVLDIFWGLMKQKIRFGILIKFPSILNVFLSGIFSFFILCTVIRVTFTKTAVKFFILYYTWTALNCFFLASYPNDGKKYKNTQKYTGLPDKREVNMNRTFIKMPKLKTSVTIRRPGLGTWGWYQGDPWELIY